jgi:hypothetical protein
LDPEGRDIKDEFLEIFYSKLMSRIVDGLLAAKDTFSKSLILELITYCASVHRQRIVYYVANNKLMQRLESLYRDKSKCIRVAMVRLIRTLVALNNDGLNKYLAMKHLFEPVMKLMRENVRDNLLASAILEIFSTVLSFNEPFLILYFGGECGNVLKEKRYAALPVIRKICEKYNSLKEKERAQLEDRPEIKVERPSSVKPSVATPIVPAKDGDQKMEDMKLSSKRTEPEKSLSEPVPVQRTAVEAMSGTDPGPTKKKKEE